MWRICEFVFLLTHDATILATNLPQSQLPAKPSTIGFSAELLQGAKVVHCWHGLGFFCSIIFMKPRRGHRLW